MKSRRVIFLLCSAALHLAFAGLWWQRNPAETGMAVGVVAPDPIHITYMTLLSDNISPSPSKNATSILRPSAPKHTDATIPVQRQAMQEEAAPSDYLPAGRLTRAPYPMTDIDLNDPAISNLPFTGELELTLMIDMDGTVADVIMPVQNDNGDNFAARVAERFRLARFSPGEIDGKPVRAEMKIKVVSEHPAPAAAQR